MSKAPLLLYLSLCGGQLLGAGAKSPNVQKLITKSTEKYTVVESSVPKKTVSGDVVHWDYVNPLLDGDVPEALAYIKKHTDYTSYLLLMGLRKHYPAAYKAVSTEDKSAILCSALRNTMSLNDWGNLSPSSSFDDRSAVALLETGKVGLKYLVPILDDCNSAPLFGSEEATISHVYRYRRKDFAYRYASLILGKSPVFRADPKERDKDIETLKAELKSRVPGK
ncbi:MAG TPA: hypothetical protein VGP63_06265 [Planctomycetaceae bacterium]|jgi:hypothetical protein|nr:hypothetical protein [Planctomycetaceae bacterium]